MLYDFRARDTCRRQRSATQFDYGDDYTYTSEGQGDDIPRGERGRERSGDKETREQPDGSYYSKGKYKNTAQPVLTLASATNETTERALTVKPAWPAASTSTSRAITSRWRRWPTRSRSPGYRTV